MRYSTREFIEQISKEYGYASGSVILTGKHEDPLKIFTQYVTNALGGRFEEERVFSAVKEYVHFTMLAGVQKALTGMTNMEHEIMKMAIDTAKKKILNNSLVRELSKAVRRGEIYYIYDPDYMALLIREHIKLVKRLDLDVDYFFRLQTKAFLVLMTRYFPKEKYTEATYNLQKELPASQSTRKFRVYFGRYNPTNFSIPVQFSLKFENTYIWKAVVAYYDISVPTEEWKNLARLNVELAIRKALG
ncbi:hypothetical protein [Thermococcus sp.]